MKYKKIFFIIYFVILYLFLSLNINGTENKGLKKLSIDNHELVPVFNKDTKNYNVFVNSNTKKVKINAECLNNGQINNKEKYSLKKGQNEVVISCKYNDEEIKYILNIVRGKRKEKVGLESLTIEGYELEFDPDKTEYTIDLKEEDDILKLDFSTINDNDTAVVSGNGNFYKGTNLIKITVKNEKKEVTYKIKAIKSEGVFKENLEVTNNNSSTGITQIIYIIILIICVFGIIFLMAYFLFFRKKGIS